MRSVAQQTPNPRQPAAKGFIWRVLGVSAVFLALGLAAMWFYFGFGQPQTVGLESLEPSPPLLPIEQVAPNRVRLFFTADGSTLAPEIREVAPTDSTYERVGAVLKVLLEGPRSASLRSPIPAGAKVRSVYIAESDAVVDLSAQWRDGLRGEIGQELLCIYSLINSLLLNCPDLKTVSLLIEGQPAELLHGHVDLSVPLVENLALLSPR